MRQQHTDARAGDARRRFVDRHFRAGKCVQPFREHRNERQATAQVRYIDVVNPDHSVLAQRHDMQFKHGIQTVHKATNRPLHLGIRSDQCLGIANQEPVGGQKFDQ